MTRPPRLLGTLAAAIGAQLSARYAAISINEIQFDSRLIESGNLFVAMRGSYVDGHDFADMARWNGAVAAVAEHQLTDIPTIVVSDTRAALPHLAASFFDTPSESLEVIGITGTDGKTTTSFLVDAILRAAHLCTGMVGTVAVKIGDRVIENENRQTTPESLEVQRYLATMRDAGVTHAILEATSHGIADHRLDDVAFAIAAVTNITHEHLERHGTIAEYWRTKARLFEWVAERTGIAVVNLDDPGARSVLPYTKGARVLTYSNREADSDLYFDHVKCALSGTTFRLGYGGQTYDVTLPYLGGFNAANAVCAIGVALAAEVPVETAVDALAKAPQVNGRLARVCAGQPFEVIVDYAHTPESLEKVLKLLRELNPGRRLIAVSGSAGERDRTKRPMQGAVSVGLADVSVFTSEDPRYEDAEAIIDEIAAGAREVGATEGKDFFKVSDRREAIALAMNLARAGDAVLLAGKGHEHSIIVGGVKVPWDEMSESKLALAKIGYESG